MPNIENHVSLQVVCVFEPAANLRKIVPSHLFDDRYPCLNLIGRLRIVLDCLLQMLPRNDVHFSKPTSQYVKFSKNLLMFMVSISATTLAGVLCTTSTAKVRTHLSTAFEAVRPGRLLSSWAKPFSLGLSLSFAFSLQKKGRGGVRPHTPSRFLQFCRRPFRPPLNANGGETCHRPAIEQAVEL